MYHNISQTRSGTAEQEQTPSSSYRQTDARREHTKDEGVGSTAMLQDCRVIEGLKGVFGECAMSAEDQYAVPLT